MHKPIRYSKDELLTLRKYCNYNHLPKIFLKYKNCFDNNNKNYENYDYRKVEQRENFFNEESTWNPLTYWNIIQKQKCFQKNYKTTNYASNNDYNKNESKKFKYQTEKNPYKQQNQNFTLCKYMCEKDLRLNENELIDKTSQINDLTKKANHLTMELCKLNEALNKLRVTSSTSIISDINNEKKEDLNDSLNISSGYNSMNSSINKSFIESNTTKLTIIEANNTSKVNNDDFHPINKQLLINSSSLLKSVEKMQDTTSPINGNVLSQQQLIEHVRKIYQNALLRSQLNAARKSN